MYFVVESQYMTTSIQDLNVQEHLNNWAKMSCVPTTDQIIDAFEEGIKFGYDRYDKFVKKVFKDNVIKACELSEAFHLWLLSNNIKSEKTLMKIERIDSFETLFLIPSSDYMNDEKRKLLYQKAIELRKNNNTSTFNIEFIISPNNNDINLININSHGYFLTYSPSSDVSPTKTSST